MGQISSKKVKKEQISSEPEFKESTQASNDSYIEEELKPTGISSYEYHSFLVWIFSIYYCCLWSYFQLLLSLNWFGLDWS